MIHPLAIAAKHPIRCDRPAPDFFEGALLGNGGLGAVLTTRPDAVVIRFGHNNVWDIRIAEDHKDEIGVFQDIFEKVKAIPSTYNSLSEDAWFQDYLKMARENYAKPYPRPFPCGSLVLGFDRRQVELLGHQIHIATGICEVRFLSKDRRMILEAFADMIADCLWLRMMDETGAPAVAPFDRVRLIPDPETPDALPAFTTPDPMPADVLSLRQVFPFQVPHVDDKTKGHAKDRAFRLSVRVSCPMEIQTRTNTWSGLPETMGALERGLLASPAWIACVQLDEGLAAAISTAAGNPPLPTPSGFDAAAEASQASWKTYWNRSGVALEDELLERTWYWNLYFLNCSVKPGVTCPGLFANWNHRSIGTAWHGDYHLNYNTQQPFWVTFSSNHVDKHLPYVDMVDHLLPISRKWAREYYGLRGAYFPHTGYPVEMNLMPYPVPTWGWEICETPWAVQSLWWHYLYTMDQRYLEQRAFGPIKEAVLFLVDYLRRPEAHGPQWGDDRYHIFPTVAPELYGLRPGFKNNHDCLVDLTLTRFVFHAYLKACAILGREPAEESLIQEVREVLNHFPKYPTAVSQRGEVFVSVPGENPEIVYNTPNSVMTVFPGEDHGLDSSPDEYAIAANSYRNHRNEGGNELVFLNLQGARLGLLDLDRFKRQIEYCLMPNGTCTDKALQAHGRYDDNTPFDFMARMGIWFENFALPVVINECLLHSYNGTLRFFPNWPKEKRAEFRTLRAAGAFLVSAAFAKGEVEWIEILSEAGLPLRLLIPWETGARCLRASGETTHAGKVVETGTSPGETLRFVKSS
ncbi:MAG: hypothetical protein HY360_02350 [Verrucomicrobia bacterium]|nr:hypothetical protein [Verrucomicrobiota bacterium]